MSRFPLIVVTDGDDHARRAVEEASSRLGLRTISRSGGTPTGLDADAILDLAALAPPGPLVVMVDDHGHPGAGHGDATLRGLLNSSRCDVIGVVAVAARRRGEAIRVARSVDAHGRIVAGAVDKYGHNVGGPFLYGDTVAPLYDTEVPVIGIGDLGKYHSSAAVLMRAFDWLLRQAGETRAGSRGTAPQPTS